MYDDYKFVTQKELDEIGLAHLVGTNLLRAYMHGYFMDMRLYRKAKTVAAPFVFDDFKKRKIQERLQAQRASRVNLSRSLPSVNKELALKFLGQQAAQQEGGTASRKTATANSLLSDSRFSSLFANPDFQVDKDAPEYRLLNPVLSKMDKKKAAKLDKVFKPVADDDVEEEVEGVGSSDEDDDLHLGNSSSGSDSEEEPRNSSKGKKMATLKKQSLAGPKFYELKTGQDFKASDLNSTAPQRKGQQLKSR